MDANPAELAAWARAFEDKLSTLAAHADPERLRHASPPWACVASLPDRNARQRIAARLFVRDVGPLPRLSRLLDRNARLVLLDRESLMRHLCALALARRPGVLRCCVAREVRARLRRALGCAFDALMSASHLGRARPESVTNWTPVHWTCVGYFDWTHLLEKDDSALRRIVRLSLPSTLLGMQALRRLAPADFTAQRAVELMVEHGVEWSC